METDITRTNNTAEAYDRAYEQGARHALKHGFAFIHEGEKVYKISASEGTIRITIPADKEGNYEIQVDG